MGKWKQTMENLSVVDQMRHDVNGDGEDDGAVVLGRDAVQGLQVPQLGGE